MPSDDARQESGDYHPLPEILDAVLNGPADNVHGSGWDVEIRDGEIEIGRYDDPPENGGSIEVVARIPVEDGDWL